jgi:hypothetical protein
MAQTQDKTPGRVEASNVVANLLAAGDTALLEVQTGDLERLTVEIVLSADQALDTFVMQAKIHRDSAYVQITNAITATPGGVVILASGTLATTGAGATAWALLDVRAFHSVKFLASAAVDGADVTIRARGHGTV